MNTIPLPGASGSGPFSLVSDWVTAFTALYPEAQWSLASIGSGATQQALWGDVDCMASPALCEDDDNVMTKTVWGIGDAPFGDDAYLDHVALGLQQLPACAGAVVMVHSRDILGSNDNDHDNVKLRMNLDVLTGIFTGSITSIFCCIIDLPRSLQKGRSIHDWELMSNHTIVRAKT